MRQKFFMLLAAVLLSSASVFAQSNEPLKGDVNGDGTVDVADITAVIKIMKDGGGTAGQAKNYFYVGTTKPTSLDDCWIVSEYPAEQYYTNNSGTAAKIYVLVSADKNVTLLEFGIIDVDVDTTSIPGYKIIETISKCANGGVTKIRIS